jgi:hypothetical protein
VRCGVGRPREAYLENQTDGCSRLRETVTAANNFTGNCEFHSFEHPATRVRVLHLGSIFADILIATHSDTVVLEYGRAAHSSTNVRDVIVLSHRANHLRVARPMADAHCRFVS